MSAELSVVIPSHNRPDLLRACLVSVTRYAPADTEILVVDDGSPGGSVSAVAVEFAHTRCLRSPRRRGFCAAANAGIAAARTPVVELLNDDTEVEPGWAEAALARFTDPAVAAVAPLVLRWDGTGEPAAIDSAGDCYFRGGVAAKRGHGQPLPWAGCSSGAAGTYRSPSAKERRRGRSINQIRARRAQWIAQDCCA